MALPWDNLNDYVHDWMKGLQEILDSIAPDPDADNSMLPLASLPYKFDCTLYCIETTRYLIDGYDTWDKGYGYQPWLIGYRLNLTNNVLRVVNQEFMGKCTMSPPDRWGWLTNEDIATIEAAGREVYSRSIEVVNNYPTNTIKVIGGNYGTVSFKPLLHDVTDIQIKYPSKNDTTVLYSQSLIGASTTQLPEYDEDTGFYNATYYGDHQGTGSQPNYSVYSNLIAVFDSITEAEYIVNTLSQYNTNNDVINYTKTGSEYKLYYGDHYLIYALDDSKIYNYQDLFTGTKQATDGINTWNPSAPPIKTPTYNEVKHEDDPDYDDDNYKLTETGCLTDIGGSGKYWLFDSPPDGVFQDFNLNAPEGSMISQNILSCYVSALKWDWQTVNQQMVIYTNGSKKPAYTSTSAYPYIYQWNPHMIAGQIKVPRCTETFLDFSPYSIYELYIPFCGWIGLPDTVVGRNIRVYMDCDAALCTCKAYVMVEMEDGSGDTIIGEITGAFGAPCPIQVTEGGLYRQAMVNSGLQIATGLASGLYGASAGAGALAISGFSNALQGIQNANVANNTNYSQTIGRSGDSSSLCGGHYCYLRVTHPVIDKVVEEQTFAHTIGYLCNEVGTLSDYEGTGFTVCLNPHITGIDCTLEEREMIKGYLENGVIL